MSVADQLRALDEQRTTLLERAKAEALERAEKVIADLSALGFDCSFNFETGSPQHCPKDRREIGTTSIIDQLRALNRRRAALAEQAKAEALDMAQHAIVLLNEVGFPHRLVDVAQETLVRVEQSQGTIRSRCRRNSRNWARLDCCFRGMIMQGKMHSRHRASWPKPSSKARRAQERRSASAVTHPRVRCA